jgi:hypothetical protein
MFSVAVGMPALGTTSWTPDRDLVFKGVCKASFGTGSLIVSTRPNMTTAFAVQPGVGDSPLAQAILAVAGPNAQGFSQLNIPVRGGDPIYVCFSAGDWCVLYFDEPAS